MKFLNPIAILLTALALTAPSLVAQQCQPGQWGCVPTPMRGTADQVEEYQRQVQEAHERKMQELERQAERQRDEEQANRPMCTTYTTDPVTGAVKARTVPCLY